MTDMDDMALYYRLNLFHVICLNSVFTKCFSNAFKVRIDLSLVIRLN
jgi:hypothetical protein